MEKETSICNSLSENFPQIDITHAVITNRRIFLFIPEEIFMDVLSFAAKELGFGHLCAITGLDTGNEYEFIYHISNHEGVLMNLKRKADHEDPVVISSVLPVYQGAIFYELELEGLLGIKVDGLPEGRQYPLPDNWPKEQYPMRKSWMPPARNLKE